MSGEDKSFLEQLQREFLDEVTFLLEQCEESFLKLEKEGLRSEELAKIFRAAHSIKGAGAAVGFNDLSGFAHHVEDLLSFLRAHPRTVDPQVVSLLFKCYDALKARVASLKSKDDSPWRVDAVSAEIRATLEVLSSGSPKVDLGVTAAPKPDQNAEVLAQGNQKAAVAHQGSVKIDIDRVENVMNLVGELVVIKSQLTNQCAAYRSDLKLDAVVSLMDKTIRELQDKALSMRMMPLKSLFLKTQRIIRDLAVKFQKPIAFEMSGEETEIDRSMVELLADPLMHIVRNSIDHGIEPPAVRQSKGKPEKGLISLKAFQTGDRVLIQVRDDGGGISAERVAKKAVEKGLIPSEEAAKRMDPRKVLDFIFAPGFSTAERVTEVSGRGVGMDVVKTHIERLKGTIEITTKEGQGTCISLHIPLTTSITDGMIIGSRQRSLILPTSNIRELISSENLTHVEVSVDREVINHRGKILPVLDLNRLLNSTDADYCDLRNESSVLIVVETIDQVFALRVDRILGQTQVVLKSLGSLLPRVPGVSGAAILNDGRVALVLDPTGLSAIARSIRPSSHDFETQEVAV